MKKAELVYDAKARLAEGPFWDKEQQQLIWVDIEGKTVNFLDPLGENEAHPVEQRVGVAVLSEKGYLYLGMDHGFYRYDRESRKLTQISDPEEELPGNRFNDGKCDPLGNFWAGTMVLEGEEGNASLYKMDTQETVTTEITDLTISNGLVWDEKKELMYFIDTPTHQIRAYPFDFNRGVINGEAKIVFEVPDDFGHPDGMTMDREGMLWVAFFDGGCVRRIDPEEGKVLEKIDVPASNVTSCCFGGSEMDELFITTAREGKSEEELAEEPHAGGIFRVKPGVKGVNSYRFQDYT
ncbi:SMP-30/gluconolactonase/LRE family protein [Alkalicoccus daliensis]|uniref:Sugar lactone lactonase YvrE n=1 Tax=Alkalicoccus daliensis TaxID=745820 RepID=A0A1H0HJ53_9BACI|nr:SMP-30/gluconolactonase/LRE family protein [Alkalicoccus daliensis]SDO19236.1 Sugar lactone lactonase YvrE [Alkalicoccus daliensis]